MEDKKPTPGAFLIYSNSVPSKEKTQLTPEQMESLMMLHYALNKECNVRLIAVLIGIPLIALIVCCIM